MSGSASSADGGASSSSSSSSSSSAAAAVTSFEQLRLDDRIVSALADMGFSGPLPVQTAAITAALAGQDTMVRAHTGSGKTIAYLVPLVQTLLVAKESGSAPDGVRGVILMPTRELCGQVAGVLKKVLVFLRKTIKTYSLGKDVSHQVHATRLAANPDVVISTPGRLAAHLRDGSLTLKDSLAFLIVDEADYVLSYGYGEDVRAIASFLPEIYQAMLLSATLSDDVKTLEGLLLHNPTVLNVGPRKGKKKNKANGKDNGSNPSLRQFYVRCSETDKYLLLFALLRLKVIKGRSLIFVNSVSECYRLKLFLERLFVKVAVINAELPANSRYSVVQQFNAGVYDHLIATDAGDDPEAGPGSDSEDGGDAGSAAGADAAGPSDDTGLGEDDGSMSGGSDQLPGSQSGSDSGEAAPAASDDDGEAGSAKGTQPAATKNNKKNKKKKNKGRRRHNEGDEYGISRGIDFQNVSTVFNFELPPSATSYIHRVGRTARGTASGTALSLVSGDGDNEAFERLKSGAGLSRDDAAVINLQRFAFDIGAIESFRYRVEDVLRGITPAAIRNARATEIKAEMLNSDKLKAFFEDNPQDLAALRHAKDLLPAQIPTHLKRIPEYLLDGALKGAVLDARSKAGRKGRRRRGAGSRNSAGARQQRKRRAGKNPLKSFKRMKTR